MNNQIINQIHTKVCPKCKIEKPVSEFHKNKSRKDGFANWCSFCDNQQSKKWRSKNQEYQKQYNKQWQEKNPNVNKKRTQQFRLDHPNHNKQYYSEHKDKIVEMARKRSKQRRKTDVNFRTLCYLRNSQNKILNRNPKHAHTMEYTMCSNKEFVDYIESLWLPGMTWENRGTGSRKWQIDHIIPCSFFKDYVLDEVEKYMCFRYQNLQPLWWEDNRAKSNKVPFVAQI